MKYTLSCTSQKNPKYNTDYMTHLYTLIKPWDSKGSWLSVWQQTMRHCLLQGARSE